MTAPGTWALHTDLATDEVNVHLPALDAAGLLGIAEQEGRATLYLSRRSDALPVAGRWEHIPDQDWNAVWKADFDPVVVGRIAVVAPWHEPPAAEVTLVVEPAQAFGTGHHETTTACLAALQQIDLAGRSVFDVGTGTGVLALAAKALGAGRVFAVDTDPLAVEAATANAQRNGIGVEVAAGSADAAGGERFDVVVANIDTATLTDLAPDLVACLADGGRFVGSGVSNERMAEALAVLGAAGMDVSATPGDQWALLTGAPSRR